MILSSHALSRVAELVTVAAVFSIFSVASPSHGGQVERVVGDTAIYESITYGVAMRQPIATDSLPSAARQAFAKYAARISRFTTRIVVPSGSEEREVWGERTGIERVVFSLFDAPGIEREAEAFVQAIPFYYEAEGNIWTVLTVPDAADEYVRTHPRSAIRDYALFFAGQRRYCAVQSSDLAQTAEGARQMLRAREDLVEALRSKHPLIRYAANRPLGGDCAP